MGAAAANKRRPVAFTLRALGCTHIFEPMPIALEARQVYQQIRHAARVSATTAIVVSCSKSQASTHYAHTAAWSEWARGHMIFKSYR